MTMYTANREAYDAVIAAAKTNGWTAITDTHGLSKPQTQFFNDGRFLRFTKENRQPVDVYWNKGGYMCVNSTSKTVLAALNA